MMCDEHEAQKLRRWWMWRIIDKEEEDHEDQEEDEEEDQDQEEDHEDKEESNYTR